MKCQKKDRAQAIRSRLGKHGISALAHGAGQHPSLPVCPERKDRMKTHQMITDKHLRECYAAELNELRQTSLWKNATADERYWFLLGFDSAFWSQQKRLNVNHQNG